MEAPAALRKRARRIARKLAKAYPDAQCALRFRTPFELLIATILSAQCTDKKVNEVTASLFERCPTPQALATANPEQVEELIRPTGFYRQKTRSIQAVAADLMERFGTEVPATMDDLLSLRGVARKTANVVLGNAFGIPGLSVDTHMKRVSRRLELTSEEDPARIELDLMELIPQAEWTQYSQRVIHHGRVCCDARRPRCEVCPVRADCPWPGQADGVVKAGQRKGGARSLRPDAAENTRA